MNEYIEGSSKELMALAEKNQSIYLTATPFPHITFHDFFNTSYLDLILKEFPDLSKKKTISHNNTREIKYGSKGELFFGKETKKLMHFLNSEPFLNFLQKLTGIKEQLIPDPHFSGGGQHEIKKGGLLKIHVDFNKHPETSLDRRINVLVYLNKDWQKSFGGYLELWNNDMSECGAKILPIFNTLTVFSTTDFSYHGHPDSLNCPEDRSRKSLALYYYSNGRPAEETNTRNVQHGTLFKPRKGNKNDSKAFSFSNYSVSDILIEILPPIVIKSIKRMVGKK
ncbi:MAG: 2OG-Fe(II) oxygenase [Saprospiraceae bacterium]